MVASINNFRRSDEVDLSIVIPLFDEEESIPILYEKLKAVLNPLGKKYEIIFVDDGSTDKTFDLISDLHKKDASVRIIKLRRNFGQTSSLSAGIDFAAGEIIITMDGDLQHDPSEIVLFLDEIDKGFDVVCSWRKNRNDPFLLRVLPSAIANYLIRLISGVKIHDFGGTYRAYRKDIIKKVEFFGDAHRLVPALSSAFGAKISEVVIKSIPRKFGQSHYGISRTFRVILDLIFLRFLLVYIRRPLHFFGFLGLLTFGSGMFISTSLVSLWLLNIIPTIRDRIAMLVLSVFLMLAGIQFLTLGILAELTARIYLRSRRQKIYDVAKID